MENKIKKIIADVYMNPSWDTESKFLRLVMDAMQANEIPESYRNYVIDQVGQTVKGN